MSIIAKINPEAVSSPEQLATLLRVLLLDVIDRQGREDNIQSIGDERHNFTGNERSFEFVTGGGIRSFRVDIEDVSNEDAEGSPQPSSTP